jgi:KH domain
MPAICCSTCIALCTDAVLLLLLLLSTAPMNKQAPVNVNAAGVEDEVVSHMIDCPPHLIGLLIGRGGSTIKRIKEESRANVVINQKMMKVCVCILYLHTVLYTVAIMVEVQIVACLYYSHICPHCAYICMYIVLCLICCQSTCLYALELQ